MSKKKTKKLSDVTPVNIDKIHDQNDHTDAPQDAKPIPVQIVDQLRAAYPNHKVMLIIEGPMVGLNISVSPMSLTEALGLIESMRIMKRCELINQNKGRV